MVWSQPATAGAAPSPRAGAPQQCRRAVGPGARECAAGEALAPALRAAPRPGARRAAQATRARCWATPGTWRAAATMRPAARTCWRSTWAAWARRRWHGRPSRPPSRAAPSRPRASPCWRRPALACWSPLAATTGATTTPCSSSGRVRPGRAGGMHGLCSDSQRPQQRCPSHARRHAACLRDRAVQRRARATRVHARRADARLSRRPQRVQRPRRRRSRTSGWTPARARRLRSPPAPRCTRRPAGRPPTARTRAQTPTAACTSAAVRPRAPLCSLCCAACCAHEYT